MTTTEWKNPVSGDFNHASNWTAGVPAAGDTALITASGTYTVTSSQANSVGTLEMVKDATLAISSSTDLDVTSDTVTGVLAGTITVAALATLGLGTDATNTTYDNTGTIDLSTATLSAIGAVTLTGKGKVSLSHSTIQSANPAATLTNDSTISGGGDISFTSGFANAAKGVVDANSSIFDLTIYSLNTTNSGLMEATTGSGFLWIVADVTQTAKGQIKAATSGAQVYLSNGITITGGVISTVAGSSLDAGTGTNTLSPTTPITNDGTIDTDSGNFVINGSVKGAGTLLAADSNFITVTGAVTGGKADIEGAGEINIDGKSSVAVTFSPGSTGMLTLGDATKFTGTVAGMSTAPGAAIDLTNIFFADITSSDVNFSPTKHLLTVFDPASSVTDKIKISGSAGTFTPSLASDGTTLISDPPASPESVPHANTDLLAQSMASFGASSSIVGSGTGSLAEHHTSSDFLAVNSHHG